MSERIPQSVDKLVVFRAYLASDGKTPATGKTIAITISKNGATSFSNPAAGATNATEMASGFYKFTLGTGDIDTKGPLAWRGAHADIDDAGDVYTVVNATNADFTSLPNAAAGAAGGVLLIGTNTGHVEITDGIEVGASTADRIAFEITGNGAGAGISVTAGPTGTALRAIGGSTSGDAVVFQGTAGNARGMLIQGQGSNDGLEITGGATGIGIDVNGGASSGTAIEISAVSGHAVTISSATNDGVRINSEGPALRLWSGADNTPALAIEAFGAGSNAIEVLCDLGVGVSVESAGGDAVKFSATSGNNEGIHISGSGNGSAVRLDGGSSGSGLLINGGSVSGAAIALITQDTATVLAATSTFDGTLGEEFSLDLLSSLVNSSDTVRDALDRTDAAGGGGGLTQADVRTAVGLGSANLDAQLAALQSGIDGVPSTGAIASAVATFQFTESYRANGASPTLAQALCELLAHHGEAANSGTTKTLNAFDHSTPVLTFTYDDASAPNSVTRAS